MRNLLHPEKKAMVPLNKALAAQARNTDTQRKKWQDNNKRSFSILRAAKPIFPPLSIANYKHNQLARTPERNQNLAHDFLSNCLFKLVRLKNTLHIM